MSTKIPPQFIVRLPIRNDAGEVLHTKEFITYQGLLAMAHDMGLERIDTKLLQGPTDPNKRTAIVHATAKGKTGTFTGLGDANPENVNRKVVRHLLRVAETRAKARALRDLTNVSMVALEELGGDDDSELDDAEPAVAPPPRPRTARAPRTAPLATRAQQRALWHKARALGHEPDQIEAFLTERLGATLATATKEQASRLLDALSREARHPAAARNEAAE